MAFFKKKSKQPETDSREERLARNENQPFSIEMPEEVKGDPLAYKYERVKCTIVGDVSGLKEGAVLYTRRNGILANAAKEQIAQIDNKKLQEMVNDFFEKDRFSTVRARFIAVDDNCFYCNLGFYLDNAPPTDDE